MKSKENLVFLGMMGSGKSSIGSLVAKKLKVEFIDVDKEIEKELGMKLPLPGEKLPEDIEFRISELAAPAAAQLLGKNQQEASRSERCQSGRRGLRKVLRGMARTQTQQPLLPDALC